MASCMAAAATMAPAAALGAATSSVTTSQASTSVKAFTGLKSATLFAGNNTNAVTSVSNGSRVQCMQVWTPVNNLKFETLSYLPPLNADAIAKQVDYILRNGWIPCIEFDMVGTISQTNFKGSGYYDNRYWTMWKLPLFGATDSSLVLAEIEEAKKAYPDAYIRVMAFDNVRQVQVAGFIAQRPA
jgi:ribulose-bisphosphate carboxylase small chain